MCPGEQSQSDCLYPSASKMPQRSQLCLTSQGTGEGALGAVYRGEVVGGVHPSVSRPHPPLPSFPPELHSKLQSSEAVVKSKCEELSGLHGQLQEARAENSQLTERIQSIEALLEAGQARDTQDAQVSLRRGREKATVHPAK